MFLPVLPKTDDSLVRSPLWVTITIRYILPCRRFWNEHCWRCCPPEILSWRDLSGLYRKMSYESSSPCEVVQLKDSRSVVFSVTFRKSYCLDGFFCVALLTLPLLSTIVPKLLKQCLKARLAISAICGLKQFRTCQRFHCKSWFSGCNYAEYVLSALKYDRQGMLVTRCDFN